jgi:hypothetical protein
MHKRYYLMCVGYRFSLILPNVTVHTYTCMNMVSNKAIEKFYSPVQPHSFFNTTFPNNHYAPTLAAQNRNIPLVSPGVASNLWAPKLGVALWLGSSKFTRVRMPEASVHKYDLAPPWKHQIRCPCHIAPVEDITVTQTMKS